MRKIAIGLASIALGGCSSQAATPPPPEPGETIAHLEQSVAYGGAGILTDAQGASLKGLAWPQSYEDMIGTFGLPNQRRAEADIYKLANGSEFWVFYEGSKATGLEIK